LFISTMGVFCLKAFAKVFYRTEARWLTPAEDIDWPNLKLAVILNHTSLFEPLFVSALPNIRIWRGVRRVVAPVADKTMNRPIVGRIFRFLSPNIIAITRKRDDSWQRVIESARGNSIILIFPEGRMKRVDGLDKDGNPMSVKGGVADLISKAGKGKMLVAYSGGLHHVQAPGQIVPRLFKKIRITFEEVDMDEYRASLGNSNAPDFREKVISDLESRMSKYC